MTTPKKITVVGASLAGLRAVQSLRREGFDGEITLVGAETHLPYNRPPLSKAMLRGDDDIQLPGAEELGDGWLPGRRATALDAARRTVTLDDGAEVAHDGLVIATGARPRAIGGGARTLRTVEDALELRRELEAGHEHVVVIGGGFIGGEVASTARELGHKVTLIDSGSHPMRDGLGEVAASWLAGLHERSGVELITGTRVTAVEDGRVVLSDGRTVAAGLVVAGVGVTPNTEWLEGSGLLLDDGVVCDQALFASGRADIVAAGDVARWPHPLYGGASVRVEHWSNANDQGPSRHATCWPGRSGPHRTGTCRTSRRACTVRVSRRPGCRTWRTRPRSWPERRRTTSSPSPSPGTAPWSARSRSIRRRI